MSYFFVIKASDKTEATSKIREQFDAVVDSQPSHEADKEAVVVAAQNLVRILADPADGQEIYINMYGSLSWEWKRPATFTAASATINVSLRKKE